MVVALAHDDAGHAGPAGGDVLRGVPSTQEKTRSMSKLMSLAWSANMFSMVGQVWP